VQEIASCQFVARFETCRQASAEPNDIAKSADNPFGASLTQASFVSKVSWESEQEIFIGKAS
jgi:hypothetical protein